MPRRHDLRRPRAPAILAISLGALAGAACSDAAVEAIASAPPPARAPALRVPNDRIAAASRLAGRVDAGVAAGGARWRDAFEADSATAAKIERACAEVACAGFELLPRFPAGAGLVADARLRTRSAPLGLGSVFVGPDRAGAWTIQDDRPAEIEGGPTQTHIAARVALAPSSGELSVAATITLRPAGQRYLLFDFMPEADPSRDSIELERITQGDTPCPFLLRARVGLLVVELPRLDEETALSFRYRASLPGDATNTVATDEIRLYRSWVPYLGGPASWEVEVDYPDGFSLQGPARPARLAVTAPGRALARFEATGLEHFPLVGAPRYVTRSAAIHGTQLTFYLWPEHAGRAEALTTAVRAALHAFEPLGDFPSSQYRIVESGAGGGRRAIAFPSMMIIGHELLDDDNLAIAVAHELAHAWFAIDVIDDTGRWSEAVASYLSLWPLDADRARDQRWSWVIDYEQVAPNRDLPLLGSAPVPDDRGLVEAIFYGKGALVLTALERRVGRDEMAALLASFAHSARGTAATWRDLVAQARSVLGDEQAAWLDGWLRSSGAPDFRLEHVRRERGYVTGVLRLRPPPASRDAVELGLVAAGSEIIARHRVAVAGATTTFRLRAPRGAKWLVVDPDYLMPRKPALDGHPRWMVELSARR